MSVAELKQNFEWQKICPASELLPNLGLRALFNGNQVAIFRVQDNLYALDAFDPFSQAAILSRGIVGDLGGKIVVASPIYKQHFNLETGQCLEDKSVCLRTYPIVERDGFIWVAMAD